MNTCFLSHEWGAQTPNYANGEAIEIAVQKTEVQSHKCQTLQIKAPNHRGTHFDFPRHFDPQGMTLSDYEAKDFIYEKVYLARTMTAQEGLVGVEDLEVLFKLNPPSRATELLLIQTGAESYRLHEDFWSRGPGLGLGLAEYIRESLPQCRAIGVDSISITSFSHRELGRKVHEEFLKGPRPLLIIEDMRLSELQGQSPQRVCALPLQITEADGAPCSVVAWVS